MNSSRQRGPLVTPTFWAEKADGVVGAVSPWALLFVEAPEPHSGVGVDRLPCVAGRDPVCGPGLQGPGDGTHPGAVVEADGLQLLVVSTAPGMVHVEPGGPLMVG